MKERDSTVASCKDKACGCARQNIILCRNIFAWLRGCSWGLGRLQIVVLQADLDSCKGQLAEEEARSSSLNEDMARQRHEIRVGPLLLWWRLNPAQLIPTPLGRPVAIRMPTTRSGFCAHGSMTYLVKNVVR